MCVWGGGGVGGEGKTNKQKRKKKKEANSNEPSVSQGRTLKQLPQGEAGVTPPLGRLTTGTSDGSASVQLNVTRVFCVFCSSYSVST